MDSVRLNVYEVLIIMLWHPIDAAISRLQKTFNGIMVLCTVIYMDVYLENSLL